MAELAIGRISKPAGFEGWAKVESFSGEFDHFLVLREVSLRSGGSERKALVEDWEVQGNSLLVKFAGCMSAEQAQSFVGWEFWVDRAGASPLRENQYYYADLVGCSLKLGQEAVGTVTGVLETAGGYLLEVLCGEETKLIPFRGEFVGMVDIEHKAIELLAPWILQ